MTTPHPCYRRLVMTETSTSSKSPETVSHLLPAKSLYTPRAFATDESVLPFTWSRNPVPLVKPPFTLTRSSCLVSTSGVTSRVEARLKELEQLQQPVKTDSSTS